MTPRKILITGATGFVGLNIVATLAARGHAVVAAGHELPPEAAAARAGPASVTWRVLDVRDAGAVDALFAAERPTHVISGAAVTTAAIRDGEAATATAAVNIMGCLHVLDAAARHGARRLVMLSSASVYGAAGAAGAPLDEVESIPQPGAVYGITKLAAERLLLRAGPLRGVTVTAARIGGVFGRFERDTGLRDTLSPMHQVMQASRLGQEIVLPRPGMRDWVYAPDVAEGIAAILLAEQAPPSPAYNITSPVLWSVAQWCEALAARVPLRWRIAEQGERASIDFHGPDRPPLAAERAERELGFRARFGLDEALPDYLAWLD